MKEINEEVNIYISKKKAIFLCIVISAFLIYFGIKVLAIFPKDEKMLFTISFIILFLLIVIAATIRDYKNNSPIITINKEGISGECPYLLPTKIFWEDVKEVRKVKLFFEKYEEPTGTIIIELKDESHDRYFNNKQYRRFYSQCNNSASRGDDGSDKPDAPSRIFSNLRLNMSTKEILSHIQRFLAESRE